MAFKFEKENSIISFVYIVDMFTFHDRFAYGGNLT
jgi:hypothetical protein